MKKAFSTLGCPTWNLKEILIAAKDIGMDGVEIRGIEYQMYAPKIKAFLDENITHTKNILRNIGIEISMLTSGCDLSEKNFDKVLKEAKDYLLLAQKLQCKYIRIMCENTPYQKKDLDIRTLALKYSQICDMAKDMDVFPLIETNSILAKSENMVEFLNITNRENAKVLWDIHHPYRFFSESPDKTLDLISKYISYVHIKDSLTDNKEVKYKMLGYGDIPIIDILKKLEKLGYQGYISLEWVKRWCPDLEESGVVFPQYANYIGDIF